MDGWRKNRRGAYLASHLDRQETFDLEYCRPPACARTVAKKLSVLSPAADPNDTKTESVLSLLVGTMYAYSARQNTFLIEMPAVTVLDALRQVESRRFVPLNPQNIS